MILEFLNKHSMSIASLIVAVCALLFTAIQIEDNRKHNRMTLAPLIGMGLNIVRNSEEAGFYFENNGLGPAIVKGINLRVRGKEFGFNAEMPWKQVKQFYRAQKIPFANDKVELSSLPKNHIIRPGERHYLVAVQQENFDAASFEALTNIVESIEIGMCYRSVYGDNFYVQMAGTAEFETHCLDEYSSFLFGRRIQFKPPWIRPLTYQDLMGE